MLFNGFILCCKNKRHQWAYSKRSCLISLWAVLEEINNILFSPTYSLQHHWPKLGPECDCVTVSYMCGDCSHDKRHNKPRGSWHCISYTKHYTSQSEIIRQYYFYYAWQDGSLSTSDQIHLLLRWDYPKPNNKVNTPWSCCHTMFLNDSVMTQRTVAIQYNSQM